MTFTAELYADDYQTEILLQGVSGGLEMIIVDSPISPTSNRREAADDISLVIPDAQVRKLRLALQRYEKERKEDG